LISPLLEGQFIKYKQAIPAESAFVTGIRTKTLLSSVERVALLINEQVKHPLRMKFEGNTLRLSCVTSLGKAVDNLEIDHNEPLEIGFNHRYITDALRHTLHDEVLLKANGAHAALLIVPPEGDEYVFLILPVKLKAEA